MIKFQENVSLKVSIVMQVQKKLFYMVEKAGCIVIYILSKLHKRVHFTVRLHYK